MISLDGFTYQRAARIEIALLRPAPADHGTDFLRRHEIAMPADYFLARRCPAPAHGSRKRQGKTIK